MIQLTVWCCSDISVCSKPIVVTYYYRCNCACSLFACVLYIYIFCVFALIIWWFQLRHALHYCDTLDLLLSQVDSNDGATHLWQPATHVLTNIHTCIAVLLSVLGIWTFPLPFPLIRWLRGIVGRTSVFDLRSFAVLRSTCSWWVTTYVGKPSAVGQPTRPTQPFIFSG